MTISARIQSSLQLVLCLLLSGNAYTENANVINVEVKNQGDSRYSFSVTVEHNDTGWEHYADRWELLTPDNRMIAAYELRHPHVEQQPFTRTLPYLPVPESVTTVLVRAHCSRDGYGGESISLSLPETTLDEQE